MPLAINEIMSDIKFLNEEELIELNQFVVSRIKHERALQGQKMKRSLAVGSQVSFVDNAGFPVQGKVIKIMRKFAKVDVGPVVWRVPLNALTKVAA